MRKERIAAAFLIISAFVSYSAAADNPTAREVLGKSITALGGEKNLAAIQTSKMTAHAEVQGLPGTYEVWAKAPDRYRMVLDVSVIRQERVFDGSSAWQKDTSVHELSGPDLERLKRNALFNPLLQYWQNSTPLELKPNEQIDKKDVYVIQFHPQKDSSETFYFDAKTFLPIQEVRLAPYAEGPQELKITYGDYRRVDQVMLPFSITQVAPNQTLAVQVKNYELNIPIQDSLFANPVAAHAHDPYEITLATIPNHVYKENDGVGEKGKTESWVFNVVVKEKYGRQLQAESATIECYAGKDLVESEQLSKAALAAVRRISFGGLAAQEEVFDLRHHFSEPLEPAIDKMVYKLELATPAGEKLTQELEIPVAEYAQKTKLIFPIKGNFMVAAGHDFNEAHKGEWSQHYAYDIIGLGPNNEPDKNGGNKNEDSYSWGREIIAPADGVVVFSRNDVPDNAAPGILEMKTFMGLPDPRNAVGGNNVIIDHGNGEFSFLAHMQFGSVRVKQGDKVKQGDVVGLLGNSGNSDGPHLHYHLMAGPAIFRSDGLPSSFENSYIHVSPTDKEKLPNPKRGLYVEAD
jgi:murein DD-endopeptidase MepM/ murein hydrolase activator NlpD